MVRSQDRRSPQSRVKRSALSTPPEFVGDPIAWAAWLYYEERMTQEEVADRLVAEQLERLDPDDRVAHGARDLEIDDPVGEQSRVVAL